MSKDDKTKLNNIDSGAQVNVIETVKVNGTALSVTDKAVNVTVPTKTSDLTNDSFVTDVKITTGTSISESVVSNHVATIPLATTSKSGLMSASDKTLLNSNKTNSILNKNINFNTEISAQNIILNNNKEKKLLFLVHKRKHSTDNKEEKSSNKTYTHRKHDKNDKDNIITKIQIHYRNFLISFLNEVTKKIIVEEFYKMKKLDKIINIKEYLFNNIDHHFKANTKKENMKLAESIKIKDIISPSISLCQKYKIENKNINVMKKIEEFNNPILNRILNSKYLHYFSLYYNSNRQINLREGEYNFELELSKNIKLFNPYATESLKYASNIALNLDQKAID